MDLREWQQHQVIRSEAHLILSNLQRYPEEALTGLAGVTEAARQARDNLARAKIMASNFSAPEPDNPIAAVSCGWCGNSLFMALANDGTEGNPEWFCDDLESCQKRRLQRYPDRETEELKLARAADAYWTREAEAAELALAAFLLASAPPENPGAQETILELTGRQAQPQPRPRPSWAAAHNHTIAGKAPLHSRRPR